MDPSFDELLAAAHSYWRTDNAYHHKPGNSPERLRLHARWEEELKRIDRWWSFLSELEKELQGYTLGDATSTADACFRCAAYAGGAATSRFAIVGCLSIITPVFTVYGLEFNYTGAERTTSRVLLGPLPAPMHEPATKVASRIEAMFKATPLSHELAAARVPLFVEWAQPPRTTLFHALFTSAPGKIP